MSGRVFLDTNVLIYFYSESEPAKRQVAYDLLNNYCCVTSTQALNEASNVWFKRYGWSGEKIKMHLDNIELICDEIVQIRRNTMNEAIDIKCRHGYSYYDCLMLASALESNCGIIMTEDMNSGQIIYHKLKIDNPFNI